MSDMLLSQSLAFLEEHSFRAAASVFRLIALRSKPTMRAYGLLYPSGPYLYPLVLPNCLYTITGCQCLKQKHTNFDSH